VYEIDSEHLTPDRVSLFAETRFTTYFRKRVDLRAETFVHDPRGQGVSGTWRETWRNSPEAIEERQFGVYRAVGTSVRSNWSSDCCLGALKSLDPKFRVAFGSSLVGWAPVPEELIEGSTGADRVSDQRFDGSDSLVGVHVELLALQPHGSSTTVDEM